MNETAPKLVQPWPVPSTWTWTRAGDLTDVVGGGTPSTSDPSNFDDGEVPWITPADLSGYEQQTIARGERSLTQKGLESCSAVLMPLGTVLLSSRAPVGYVVIASTPLCTNQGFKSFLPTPAVEPRFLYYFLLRARDMIRAMSSGTTFMEISAARCRAISVAIAPLNEQSRIADRIDELFSDLAAGVAALERVKRNLSRYRAAMLHAAVTGRLTEAWRKQHGPPEEPGPKLLERILVERRRQWKKRALGKYERDGKQPPKNWRDRYCEPSPPKLPPDGSPTRTLPDGWCWASVDQ